MDRYNCRSGTAMEDAREGKFVSYDEAQERIEALRWLVEVQEALFSIACIKYWERSWYDGYHMEVGNTITCQGTHMQEELQRTYQKAAADARGTGIPNELQRKPGMKEWGTKMPIKRYDFNVGYIGPHIDVPYVEETPDGAYVRAEDYDELRERHEYTCLILTGFRSPMPDHWMEHLIYLRELISKERTGLMPKRFTRAYGNDAGEPSE